MDSAARAEEVSTAPTANEKRKLSLDIRRLERIETTTERSMDS